MQSICIYGLTALEGIVEGRKLNSKVFLGEMCIYGSIQQRNEDKKSYGWYKYLYLYLSISVSFYL